MPPIMNDVWENGNELYDFYYFSTYPKLTTNLLFKNYNV